MYFLVWEWNSYADMLTDTQEYNVENGNSVTGIQIQKTYSTFHTQGHFYLQYNQVNNSSQSHQDTETKNKHTLYTQYASAHALPTQDLRETMQHLPAKSVRIKHTETLTR